MACEPWKHILEICLDHNIRKSAIHYRVWLLIWKLPECTSDIMDSGGCSLPFLYFQKSCLNGPCSCLTFDSLLWRLLLWDCLDLEEHPVHPCYCGILAAHDCPWRLMLPQNNVPICFCLVSNACQHPMQKHSQTAPYTLLNAFLHKLCYFCFTKALTLFWISRYISTILSLEIFHSLFQPWSKCHVPQEAFSYTATHVDLVIPCHPVRVSQHPEIYPCCWD